MSFLFTDKKVNDLVKVIAPEFENRNLFPWTRFGYILNGEVSDKFGKDCSELHAIVKNLISEKDTLSHLKKWGEELPWVRHALSSESLNGEHDFEIIAHGLCAELINQKMRKIDVHIQGLSNTTLCEELNIDTKDGLANLSDNRFELRRHGVVFDEKVLLYPHQFLRRFYSSNFVEMPTMLMRLIEVGAAVSIRIDPFRKTTSNHYREIIECDYWHGKPFSKGILKNTQLSGKTVHYSRDLSFPSPYDVRFTIFRTNMMDAGIRQFIIEEYCPLVLYSGEISPGVGKKYCIQKFAHFYYDQNKEYFAHLDGAVRVFEKEEYSNYLQQIEKGRDVDEKIGKRNKMFLVEGEFDQSLTQELLFEWFRYNTHIQEYFSKENVEPKI